MRSSMRAALPRRRGRGGPPRGLILGPSLGGTCARDEAFRTRRVNQALKALHLGQGDPPAKVRKLIVAAAFVVEAGLGAFLCLHHPSPLLHLLERTVERAWGQTPASIGAAPDLLHDGVAVQLLVAQSHHDVKHRRSEGQVALRSFGCLIAHARPPRRLHLRIVSLRVYPQWYYSEDRSSAQRDLH